MMSAAQQHQIIHTGRPVVRPMSNMMTMAPAMSAIAAGKRATAVAENKCPSQGRRYRITGPTQIQWLRPAAQYDRNDPRVAGDPSGRLGVECSDAVQNSLAGPPNPGGIWRTVVGHSPAGLSGPGGVRRTVAVGVAGRWHWQSEGCQGDGDQHVGFLAAFAGQRALVGDQAEYLDQRVAVAFGGRPWVGPVSSLGRGSASGLITAVSRADASGSNSPRIVRRPLRLVDRCSSLSGSASSRSSGGLPSWSSTARRRSPILARVRASNRDASSTNIRSAASRSASGTCGGSAVSVFVITSTCSASRTSARSAAAVTGNDAGTTPPVTNEASVTADAWPIRRRASDALIRTTSRNNNARLEYPTSPATPRESSSAINSSDAAYSRRNRSSEATNKRRSSSPLRCQ